LVYLDYYIDIYTSVYRYCITHFLEKKTSSTKETQKPMSIKMGNIRNQFDQFKLDTTISVISPKISRTQDLPDIVSHYKTSVQPNANKTILFS